MQIWQHPLDHKQVLQLLVVLLLLAELNLLCCPACACVTAIHIAQALQLYGALHTMNHSQLYSLSIQPVTWLQFI